MQFALLISVIVLLLLGAFLLLTHVQSFFKIKSQELANGFEFSNAQLFKSLELENIFSDTLTTSIDNKNTKLISNYHGAWAKTFSEVNFRNQKISKTILSGTRLNPKSPNLYLANTNSPLIVVGNTRLEGNSYLPKQGIKAGNISGDYYQGGRLYYGQVRESKEVLMKLDPKWRAYLKSILNGSLIKEKQIVPLKKEIKNGFNLPPLVVFDPDPIVLENQNIAGNVIIQSQTKIEVRANSILEDVLLIAPVIVINDYTKGKMQLVASKKINVGKECYLSYPSSVILFDKNIIRKANSNTIQNKSNNFRIYKNTLIEGVVTYLGQKNQIKNRIDTHLKIDEGVEIIGEVYCEGSVDLMGTIKGSLHAQSFIANQSGSRYLNHLYNAKILLNPISDYAGLPFMNSKKTVAKWLY